MDLNSPCSPKHYSFDDSKSATIGSKWFDAPTEATIGDLTFANTDESTIPANVATPTPAKPFPIRENIRDGNVMAT